MHDREIDKRRERRREKEKGRVNAGASKITFTINDGCAKEIQLLT